MDKFRKGDLIVCVNRNNTEPLIIGKTYSVVLCTNKFVMMEDVYEWQSIEQFELLSVQRQRTINEILG